MSRMISAGPVALDESDCQTFHIGEQHLVQAHAQHICRQPASGTNEN